MTTNDRTGDATSRRELLALSGAAAAGLVAGCLGGGASGGADGTAAGTTDGATRGTVTDSAASETPSNAGGTADEAAGAESWRGVELRTVRGDEPFTVAELEGPTVIQSFAVWCPKCQQQSEILSDLTDSLAVVGLNTDPNEDAAKVRAHAEEHGFGWRFAVSPSPMTEALIEQFGPGVTNAPSTPVIVACPGGDATFMSGGINSVEEIRDAAGEC